MKPWIPQAYQELGKLIIMQISVKHVSGVSRLCTYSLEMPAARGRMESGHIPKEVTLTLSTQKGRAPGGRSNKSLK